MKKIKSIKLNLEYENGIREFEIIPKEILVLCKELDRLNNIINELESFINMALEIYDNVDLPTLRMIKDKIKELKDKES